MSRREPAIETVIFDYGGVLTVSGRTAIKSWTHAERIRPETFSAALKDWLGRDAEPGTPIHRLETGNLDIDGFNVLLAARLRTVDDEPVEPAGLLNRFFRFMAADDRMHDLVRGLRARGLRTALLSNSWGNTYPWDTIERLFDRTVISGDVGLRKPDERIYRLMLRRLGLTAPRTLFIDDATPNIETADRLGMHTILHRDADRTSRAISELLPEPSPDDRQESA